MSIKILPARLANQIAAGEVVERPASVVKELIENSLDAGATHLHIDIEKGGSKRIRIIDNGGGIVKDELCLALSRHATSKIKSLDDLESIASLGFRGEALASISSVARLTLTSKPKAQSSAWQACAQGRDMEVQVQPAAHPDGTTIDVQDLFFNTPARRKFLRTEKTEFTHIDEVIRRIALARFDVTITLTHNGKIIRQYRAVNDKAQFAKRVAKVCGQKFIEHALEINCSHDGLQLWGWVATADFVRNQNDLAYSYVNGRMMRDKLINHAIRQAFADSLPREGYPAFVLYLQLDHREVDVNVHPAKHEVRFHQGRYIHDFIYSVIHGALSEVIVKTEPLTHALAVDESSAVAAYSPQGSSPQALTDYIAPLRARDEDSNKSAQSYSNSGVSYSSEVNTEAAKAYQTLLTTTPLAAVDDSAVLASPCLANEMATQVLHLYKQHYALLTVAGELRLLDLTLVALELKQQQLEQRWNAGLVSQPLLLPQQIKLSEAEVSWLSQQQDSFAKSGIVFQIKDRVTVQIRQFSACLRQQDVCFAFTEIVNHLMSCNEQEPPGKQQWCAVLAKLSTKQEFTLQTAQSLLASLQNVHTSEYNRIITLNSVVVDLTSFISKLSE
jgi:DNA mismatch repair protein MutL